MKKLLITSLLLVSFAFGHSVESAGAPPADLDPAIAGVLQKEGVRVLDNAKKPWMELWFVNAMPSGAKSGEDAVTLTTVPAWGIPRRSAVSRACGRPSRGRR
jgi:hypothetical protein